MLALVGVAVGVLLLLAAALWPFSGTSSNGSTVPVPSATSLAADGPSSVRAVPTAAARLPAAAPPVRLVVPALSVDAPVVPVGLDEATGGMEIPEDVAVVGWYRFGPGLDAAQGSTVLAGHVDGAGREGALFELRDLEPGATLVATGADGRLRSYVVEAREQWSKGQVPLDRLFARDGPARLVVITCGGPFDPDTRTYRDNLVVTALPSGAP